MGIEIERKFLVLDDRWRGGITRTLHLRQGYLVDAAAHAAGLARASVRVRTEADAAWLNIKAAVAGIARDEYEYPIPLDDARRLLDTLCDGTLEKRRHIVPVEGVKFEVDEFLGDNAGLVVAELELPAVDAPYPHPPWLGREVSTLVRYYNINLIAHPYRAWSAAERAGEATC